MTAITSIALVDFVLGSLSALGLLYLLYSTTVVVHYARFFRIVAAGLLVFAITGPVFGTFAPALIHAIHGVAALFVVIGLYDMLRREIDPVHSMDAFVDAPPADTRLPDPDPEPGTAGR